MLRLVLQAYLNLIHFDLLLCRGDFGALYQEVKNYPVVRAKESHTVEKVCAAVDMACIWYWKDVLCLQRSATTACLLKRYGIRAQMMIGAQQMPLRAHAWVEVDGRVANDKDYVREMYAVLDRC